MPTIQTNAPWAPVQPYIKTALAGAKTLYQGTPASKGKKAVPPAGFHNPSFQTYVPMSSQTTAGLNSIWNAAQGGNPLAGSSMATVQGMLAGGAQDQKYNQLYGQNAADYGGLTNQYQQLYQQAGNPYFEQAVQQQADKTAADVQRQFGGLGRIGSAADTGALVDQVGQMRTQAMANNWNQNIANQRGILGDQSSLYGNYIGNQGNILSGQAGAQQGALAAAPGAYNQQFLPGQMMTQVGAAYDDQATRQLQSQLDRFHTTDQAGWNRLNAYNTGISGSGGTAPGFNQVSAPNNIFGGILGGAYGGASIGNQILPGGTGALFGGVAGGAAGGLSSLFNR